MDITSVILDTTDPATAEAFYAALGLRDRVRLRPAGAPSSGFRGFTLSLVVSRPATVDAFVAAAAKAGAEVLKQPAKSLWGYGGSFRAPDGSAWTVASSSKKNNGEPDLAFDDLVLLLGVDDVKASKQFYTEHGLEVGKSFGGKYAEFETAGIKLAVQPRRAAAKNAGVDAAGSGSHGITIVGDAGAFTDPDGFVWETTDGVG
ncbi:glyoxalase [Nocardioides ferulae]|uniref:glyoxalase n=1 Tax=Nocardioides ferulae TaxID=2340821 RepID=UPI000EB0178A|nr:glyoxalase [Nocardioides ferulae]